MWPICVLLWMRFVMRKRFYLQTLFEYIIPVIYGVGIYLILRFSVSDDSKANALELREGAERGMHVLFTPDTNSTRQLMARVGAKLRLRRLDHLPSWNESGYFSFSNVTPYSMLEYSKRMSPTDAIIIFENMQSDFLPLKLDYTIRVKIYGEQYLFPMLKLDTDIYEQQDTDYESFTRLQWAIDTSYLQMLTGSDLGQILTLQALPSANPSKAVRKTIMLGFLTSLSFSPVFGNLNMRLSEEKNSGMHELIKIAGVSAWTINFSHVLNFVPHLVIWLTGFVIYYEVSNITYTSIFFGVIATVLHYFTIIAASFLFTHALNLNKYVDEMSVLVIISLVLGALIMVLYLKNMTLLLFGCLLPNVPLNIFWALVAARQFFGDKVTISNMWSLDEMVWILPSMPLSVGGTFAAMLLQIILYFTLGWYLSLVHPGKHGQALPWNFVCRKEYWSKTPKIVEDEERVVSGVDPLYFEKPPVGLPVGIQMSKVSKTFGRDVVLQDVTAPVYKGEITVLLGHNGAGKTTLISIITGFISATSGRVLVEGLDTRTQAQQVRRRVGQCPQHDVLFPQLSVLEHVMFFAMIRGQTYAESKASAMQLLKKLDLESKAQGLTTVLSGGMKRRTQLACALAGDASVLLLDEPTSGLDVQTRRELWNLLLNLRGEHTVLLTTHYMDEADALGDRVMALRRGVVQCHGTPMFLKRAIGSGYRLSLTTTGAPREPALTAVIQRVVPEAAVLDRQQRHISYRLPSDTSKFPELFAALEETRADLGINTIGVGRSSLDEVFVQLCSDEKPTLVEESDTNIAEPELVKASGAALHARRFKVLLQRQARYLKSQMRGTILFSLLILVGLGALTHFANNNSMKQSDEPLNSDVDLNLKMYASRARTRALVNINDEFALATLRTANSKVDFEEVPDIAKGVTV